MATAVDLNVKCRLCSSGYNILNLYDPRHRNSKRLHNYIKLATGIVVNEKDKISTSICQNCAHVVDLCYQYRLNSQRNELNLKALLAEREKSGCETVHSLDNQNTVTKVSGNEVTPRVTPRVTPTLSKNISGKVQATLQPKNSNISTCANNPKTVIDQTDETKYDHLLLPKKRLKRRMIYSDDSSDAEDDPSYLPNIGQVPKKSERLKTKMSRHNKKRTFIEPSESEMSYDESNVTDKVIEEQVQKVVEPLIEEPVDREISYIDDTNDCNVNDDDNIADTEEQPFQISPSTSKIMIEYPLIIIPKELYGINILPTINLYRNNNIEDMIHKLTAITSSDNPSPLSKTTSSLITIPIRRKTRKYVKEGSDYKRMEVPTQENGVNTKELLISSLELTAVGTPSSSIESVAKPNEISKNNLKVNNLNTPPIVDKSNLANCTKTSSETTAGLFKAPQQYPQNVCADLNQSLLTLTDYEETSFVCNICNEIKNTHRKLVLHIRKNHMACKYCHMKFSTVKDTFNHIETNCPINLCKRLPVLQLTRLEDEIDIMAKYGSAFDVIQSDTESTASSVFYTIKQTSSTKMTLVNNKAKKRTSGMKKKDEVKNIVKPKITSSQKSKKDSALIIELSDSDPEDNANIRKHPTMTVEEYQATHNIFKGCMGKRLLEKQKSKPTMLSSETQTMLPSDDLFHLNSSSNSITIPMLKEDLKDFKISVAFKKDTGLTTSYFSQKSTLKPREKSMNWSRMTPIGIKKPNKVLQPLPVTTALVNLPVSTVQVTSVHKPNCTTASGIVTIPQTSTITPTQHSNMSSSFSTCARTMSIPVNNSNNMYQTTSAQQLTQSSNALTLYNNPPNTQVLNQHLPNGVAFSSYPQVRSNPYLPTVTTSATTLPDPSLLRNIMTLNYPYKDNLNQQHTVTIFDNNCNIALNSTAVAPVEYPYDSTQYPRLQALVTPLRPGETNHPNAPSLPVLQPTSKPRLRIKEPWELR